MTYQPLADLVVVLHLGFVVFAALGGLLALRWPRTLWVHAPVAAWGAWVEISGRLCPLTPLEQRLRLAAGGTGYEGDFVVHYLLPIVYPPGLTRTIQLVLGTLLVIGNAAVYAIAWRRARHRVGQKLPTREARHDKTAT
jgi:hypothetical protein